MRSSSILRATVRLVAGAAVLVVPLAACGGGDDDSTPTESGGFSVAVSPAAATTTAGSFNVHSLSITRTGGFTGAVALRVEAAPAGVTTDISPASIPAGSTSADFLVSAATTTAPGTYPLTIIGSATGQSDRSATFTLTVAPALGSFAIGVAPAAVTISRGQTGSTTVTVTRSGAFAGAVSLALENPPTGVSGTFTPTSIPAGSTTSTLTISATAAASLGSVVLSMRGSGSGVSDRIAAVALTITP